VLRCSFHRLREPQAHTPPVALGALSFPRWFCVPKRAALVSRTAFCCLWPAVCPAVQSIAPISVANGTDLAGRFASAIHVLQLRLLPPHDIVNFLTLPQGRFPQCRMHRLRDVDRAKHDAGSRLSTCRPWWLPGRTPRRWPVRDHDTLSSARQWSSSMTTSLPP
jgi:hypothetical protein